MLSPTLVCLDDIIEDPLNRMRSSQKVHCDFKTQNHQEMDRGAAAPSFTSYSDFIRAKKRFNRRASNILNGDQVIKHFFKVMTQGFGQDLKLPSRFCWSLKEEIPDEAILRSCKGMWNVGIGRHTNGLLTLCGNGWDSFILHHDLKIGDFIVFKHTGRMVFKTIVYDSTTCEKRFSDTSENLRNTRPNDQAGCSREKGYRFTVNIKSNHLQYNYLTIPSAFLKSKDLTKKRSVILLNASGEAWELDLASYHDQRAARSLDRHVKMCNGWDNFCASNKLKIGDICIFQVDHSSTLASPTNVVMNVMVL